MLEKLLSTYRLGNIELKNRVVMAPMTRNRATDNVPGELLATYYGQRGEAGLIVTEGTSPSPNGLGYPRIPGLFHPIQVDGWRKVTTLVHKNDSRIFVQLMHTGRVGHLLNLPQGAELLAPSALALAGEMHTDSAGPQPHPVPRAMNESDIERTIGEYIFASKLAMEAGFDGVELHGANGYLIDQFLNTASNAREDRWGKTIEGRARFALEVARRVSEAIGGDHVGMRISPYGAFNGMMPDAATDELYTYLAAQLSSVGLVYIHVVDHSSMGAPPVKKELKNTLRETFRGSYILSGGYDARRAEHDLAEGLGDLVAFGRPFIANPRLVTKMKSSEALVQPDFGTFYTPGEKGYTDYPM
jgi:N-ethylmaleimide reductase